MQIIAFNGNEETVLQMACIAEKYSEHPLALSILDAGKERKLAISDPEHFMSTTGMGVEATWNGVSIVVGKVSFLRDSGIPLSTTIENAIKQQFEQGHTAVLVALNKQIIGLIAIADEMRSNIAQVIQLFKKMGVKRIAMLTGDNSQVAQAVAKKIGIDDFQANLLPKQKQDIVRKLQAEGYIVGMIGDGINDAPALALANVGIAMGRKGSDVAIETANVTIMNDNLSGVFEFMWMSGKVLKRIKLNIFFSIIYNAVGLILGVFGFMTPIIAILFQEAGCITVAVSSTLLLWTRLPSNLYPPQKSHL